MNRPARPHSVRWLDSGNAQVWGDPTDTVLTLSHSSGTGQTTISWNASVPGGTLPAVYDALRSSDPADFQTATVCLESDDTDTSAVDSSSPGPGAVVFFLVRAQNACPGGGVLGTDSSGAPRPGIDCS